MILHTMFQCIRTTRSTLSDVSCGSMFRLEILSGKKAGFTCEARRFPFGVGRSVKHGLQTEDFGLHDQHLSLILKDGRLHLNASEAADTLRNYQPVSGAADLENGDVISAGALSFRVVLGDIDQKAFTAHAILPFVIVALVSFLQLLLLFRFWN